MRWLLCLLLFCASASAAEPRDATGRVERLTDSVFVILHDDATDEWPHGNTGVVIGDDGVLVVDSDYLPSRARADIALIKKLTPKPVRFLVFTHWHFDHNNGTVAYRDAFPGVTVVAERESAHFIELNQLYWTRMSTAPDSAKRKSLAKLESELASATGEERKKRETVIAQRKNELAELGTLKVIPPNLVFDRELTLTLGQKKIVLLDRGRANSPHDVTIYLPEERILFAGDILVQSPLPFTGASWPVEWSRVLRDLEAVPIAALVPGHGPVFRDHTYTRQVRELMEAVCTRVEAAIRAGKNLEQVQETVDLSDLAKGPWALTTDEMKSDWKEVTKALRDRAFKGVRGGG